MHAAFWIVIWTQLVIPNWLESARIPRAVFSTRAEIKPGECHT